MLMFSPSFYHQVLPATFLWQLVTYYSKGAYLLFVLKEIQKYHLKEQPMFNIKLLTFYTS
jgi:hypothetical protein